MSQPDDTTLLSSFDDTLGDLDQNFMEGASLDGSGEETEESSVFSDNEMKKVPQITPQEMEELLDSQLSNLSLDERQTIYNDIYGITEVMKESEEFIQTQLEAMDQALGELENVPAYDMAVLLGPDYVSNAQFRLRFLRTDLHHPQKAAYRFAQHFQVKLELFCKDTLVQDLTQDDLDEDTLAALYSGFSQFLPLRDRAGRLVHVQFVQPPNVDVMAKCRMDFYMAMVKSEDVDTQRRGCVGIRFYNGQWSQKLDIPANTTYKAPAILSALPLRPTAMHLCHDSKSIWSPIFAIMKYVLDFVVISRTKEHYGTHEQCLFQLQTHGIVTSKDCFPLTEDGKVSTDYHKELFEKRRNLERIRKARTQQAQEQVSSTSDSPPFAPSSTWKEPEPIGISRQDDVLLGRGRRFYAHKGNVRLRFWVETKADDYNATSSTNDKKVITSQVVQLVKQRGGRFLKEDEHNAGWVEVDDETARLKVSHIFRNLRTTKTKNEDKTNKTKKKSRPETTTDGNEPAEKRNR